MLNEKDMEIGLEKLHDTIRKVFVRSNITLANNK